MRRYDSHPHALTKKMTDRWDAYNKNIRDAKDHLRNCNQQRKRLEGARILSGQPSATFVRAG